MFQWFAWRALVKVVHKLPNKERTHATEHLPMSTKTGGVREQKGKKPPSVYTWNNISLYLYSCLEFAQFAVLKHFQILEGNDSIINLQVSRIIFKNTLSKANHLKEAIYASFLHSSWLEQYRKCCSIIASSTILSEYHLSFLMSTWAGSKETSKRKPSYWVGILILQITFNLKV